MFPNILQGDLILIKEWSFSIKGCTSLINSKISLSVKGNDSCIASISLLLNQSKGRSKVDINRSK